ncbi:glycosyltransferase family 2 protein [Halosimplex litoreum]|uniref:Glycosyltransferase family 2 protein n=1 Tax=Halosimplex litoreum TaxID=1198301 RepID=A0A7T3FY05_9EURY|nr:glycosyltransferase family 2 protein [Halosimplex litoreum]QPV62854.1 glycosyltransferase family 2 protein [Halosimplex litoreum]
MKEIQSRQDSGIDVLKSIESTERGRTVTLTIESDADESVSVRVVDPVPATATVVDPVDEASADGVTGGGELVVETTLAAGTAERLRYRLVGGPATLPAVTVERLRGGQSATEPTETIGRWLPTEGPGSPLAIDTTERDSEGNGDRRDDEASSPGIGLVGVRSSGRGEATQPSASAPRPGLETLSDIAVGFVVTRSNQDAALRTAMRAGQRGHPTFAVIRAPDPGGELAATLESVGVTVLEVPGAETTRAELNRVLSTAARERGLAGLVLQTGDCPRIDYDRSLAALDSANYEVVAVPETWSDETDDPLVVVAIPAYDAAGSVGEVVERASAFADEVIVVDDGSADETAARAREAGATVVVHDRNRGYGGALKTAFREAADRNAHNLVVIDADGQHDPADIPTLVETSKTERADIVIGSRYVGGETRIPFVRSIGLAVINNLTNVSLGNLRPSGWIRDTQSGYRSYGRRAIRSLAADRAIGDNMGASTDILYHAHRNRLSVAEVGTTISYDVPESSTQGSLSHGIDLVRNILWTVEYGRPLLVVGLPGLLLTLLGVAVGLGALVRYDGGGGLAPVQLGIATLVLVGGVLVCVAALVMHILNAHPAVRNLQQ